MRGPTAFGRRLRQLRHEGGLTQDMLADRVGCATQTIRKIEAGTRRPSYQMAAIIARELGLDAEAGASFIRLARDEPGEAEPELFPQLAESLPAVLDPPSTSLPTPLTRLIAREQEMLAAHQLLRRADVRLLTLVGPGGTGKTRLGLEVAATLADHFPDGVVFVNLVPLRDPGLLIPTIADALGVREQGGRTALERLKEALRARHVLLVLDNFEQIISAAVLVAELLSACPGLKALVTSRELLRVRGEQAFPVSPLSVPDVRYATSGERVSQYAAVQLFIERALAVRPDFAVTNQNAAAVAELCQRLDGLPLAIELAAARSTLFAPEALLARLGSRLKLLTGGSRDLPARQQTLRNTIAWSYDLLTDAEQKLFRRLTAFVGGRSMPAVEAVCAAGGDLDLDVVDGLSSLVDKSLLLHDVATGEPWFLMLETIWEYGLEQLERSGEAEATRRAHAGYYLQLVEQAEPHLWGAGQDQWLSRLEQEHDNLRAALAWYTTQDEGVEPALRMAGLLWRFWEMRGHWTEGQQWLEQALSRRLQASPSVRWVALHGAGNLALARGEYARAMAYYEESLDVTRRLEHKRGVANSLLNLSVAVNYQGDLGRALVLQEEALALHREAGNNVGIALALNNLSGIYEQQGDYGRSALLAEQSLARYTDLRDRRGIAWALHKLARVEHMRARYERADELLEQARTIFVTLDARYDQAAVLNDHGELAADQEQHELAATLYAESFQLAAELGDRRRQAAVLNNMGRLALRMDDRKRAAKLCNQSLALRRELGDKRGIAMALESLGQVALQEGAYERSALLYRESLALAVAAVNQAGIARCFEGLAEVAGAEHQSQRAVRLLGAAAALRETLDAPLPAAMRLDQQRSAAALREQLGEPAFETLRAEGQAMSLKHAVTFALGQDLTSHSASRTG